MPLPIGLVRYLYGERDSNSQNSASKTDAYANSAISAYCYLDRIRTYNTRVKFLCVTITLQGIIVLHAGIEPASSDRKSDILTTRRMEQKSADENYQLNSRYFTIDSRVVLAMRNSTL